MITRQRGHRASSDSEVSLNDGLHKVYPDSEAPGSAPTDHPNPEIIRQIILTHAADLEEIDTALERLAENLPEAAQTFDLLAELGEAIRCVRLDLLADALKTLRFAATADEQTLRRDFEEWR